MGSVGTATTALVGLRIHQQFCDVSMGGLYSRRHRLCIYDVDHVEEKVRDEREDCRH